jgi:hypothetical protein
VLAWEAGKDYDAPFEVALSGDRLKVLIMLKWEAFECLNHDADIIWQTKAEPNFNDIAAHNRAHVLAKFRLNEPVRAGDVVRFAIDAVPPDVADAVLPVWLYPGDEEREGPVNLTTRPGPAEGFRVIVRPAPEKDGMIRAVLYPEDAGGFPTAFDEAQPLTLTANGTPIWEGEITGSVVLDLDVSAAEGPFRLTAHLPGGEEIISNPAWRDGPDGRFGAFGALHWHTDLSGDGMRPMETAFKAARDIVNLDFAAPGDHTPKDEKWARLVSACDKFNDPGAFVALYGWEQSSNEGHLNFYFLDPDHPMTPDNFAYSNRPAEYIEDVPHRDFIAIPHHTNAVSKAIRDDGSHYWTAYPWGEPRDDYLRQVEIFQTRGNFEREDPPEGWRTDHRNHGGSVQAGLEKGHKLGFVGGTDNHNGWPAKVSYRPRSWIVTGAWVKARTREAVYEALYARHTWACWDTRAIVQFTVGGVLQGGILNLDAPRELAARVRISAEAPLDTLEVVTEGDRAIPFDIPAGALDIEAEISLGRAQNGGFYYLRARQIDGALIYASPVFITFS